MPFCSFVTLKFISRPIGILASRMYVRICAWWIGKSISTADFYDEVAADKQIDSIAAIQ
jgi:hypothetical protein